MLMLIHAVVQSSGVAALVVLPRAASVKRAALDLNRRMASRFGRSSAHRGLLQSPYLLNRIDSHQRPFPKTPLPKKPQLDYDS